MTRWSAVVPFNHGRPRKTRLASILPEEERDALAQMMARHVVDLLNHVTRVEAVHLLAPVDPGLSGSEWIADEGSGLNPELARARSLSGDERVLLIHADLPLLSPGDVDALIDAAEAHGAAIAPDRAGEGTNAIAFADDRPFLPLFGAGSLARHRLALPDAGLVVRDGLGIDVDDPASLRDAVARGLVLPFPFAPADRA